MFRKPIARLLLVVVASLAVSSLIAGRADAGADARIARHRARTAELGVAAAAERILAALDGRTTDPFPGRAPALLPAPRRAIDRAFRFEPGDLISSVGANGLSLRISLRPKSARVRKGDLDANFVSRGIAHDPLNGRLAIAAVSQVLIYDPTAELLTILSAGEDDEAFGFVNDVAFDAEGLLIIADQGAVPDEKEPRDGRIWQYDPASGEILRIGQRRELSNPALLAIDSRDRIHFVDIESGALIVPFLEPRWDTVFRIQGRLRKAVRPAFNDAGLQATAFDFGPDDRFWFGALNEIAILAGQKLSHPCPVLDQPFEFVTGLVTTSESTALLADGADVLVEPRLLHEVDDECVATERARGKKIAGARGLALVEELEQEPESVLRR